MKTNESDQHNFGKKPSIKTVAPLMQEALETIESLRKERDQLKKAANDVINAVDYSTCTTMLHRRIAKLKSLIN